MARFSPAALDRFMDVFLSVHKNGIANVEDLKALMNVDAIVKEICARGIAQVSADGRAVSFNSRARKGRDIIFISRLRIFSRFNSRARKGRDKI